jgi:hypothetical protein
MWENKWRGNVAKTDIEDVVTAKMFKLYVAKLYLCYAF